MTQKALFSQKRKLLSNSCDFQESDLCKQVRPSACYPTPQHTLSETRPEPPTVTKLRPVDTGAAFLHGAQSQRQGPDGEAGRRTILTEVSAPPQPRGSGRSPSARPSGHQPASGWVQTPGGTRDHRLCPDLFRAGAPLDRCGGSTVHTSGCRVSLSWSPWPGRAPGGTLSQSWAGSPARDCHSSGLRSWRRISPGVQRRCPVSGSQVD